MIAFKSRCFLLFVVLSSTGCLYDLSYYRHNPTSKVVYKKITPKRMDQVKEFVFNDVLFVPRMKFLSNRYPRPYSYLDLYSLSKKSIHLCMAELTSEGSLLAKVELDMDVEIDNKYETSNAYLSDKVKMFDYESVDVNNLLGRERIKLSVFHTDCDSFKNKIDFILDRRDVKDIAWAT